MAESCPDGAFRGRPIDQAPSVNLNAERTLGQQLRRAVLGGDI